MVLAILALTAAVAGGQLAVTVNTTRPHAGRRVQVSLTGVIDTVQFQMRSAPRATATASNETPQRDAKRGGQ